MKPQSKSKYERDSGGYFVGDVPLYFDRSAGFDILKGHQMDTLCL